MWKSCRVFDHLHRPLRTQVQRLCTGLQRPALALRIQRQLILYLQPQRRFERFAVGVAAVFGLRIVAQVGLEDPRRTHRQEVLVHQRLEVHVARVDQALQGGRAAFLVACGQAFLGGEVAEICEALFAHLRQVIRELGKVCL